MDTNYELEVGLTILGIFAIITFSVLGIGYLLHYIAEIIYKNQFAKTYGLDFLPKEIKVKKNNKIINNGNYYTLAFPKWHFSNKDGSKNRVRKDNYLSYYNSTLYFYDFIITSAKPYTMVKLVNELRKKQGESSIKKNEYETAKLNTLRKKKTLLNNSNDIQNIIDSFSTSPSGFETFCAELFTKMGYNSKVTPKTNDGGYDIILNKGNDISIVECKCYAQNHSIGRPLIQKLVGANQEVKANYMIFVTTSKFSKEAIAFAEGTKVKLIDGMELIRLLNQYYQKENLIIIPREEWELSSRDLRAFYPPDVNIE